ncbi:hypothetical protein K7432_013475 [Basidiobolus ranarum]|uniref:RlpA-like protein double-psi beta-barrel domain-containing protein n=1 Tax=Basidiobolus ranarum TaxID=34480 RepID=A0ABR2WJ71_9FUNG
MFKSAITLSLCLLSAQTILGAQFAGYADLHQKSSLSKRDYSGDGTYFTPDRDACSKRGDTSSENDMIAALSKYQFGQGPGQDTEEAAMCGKCVKVTGPKGSVVVRIRDLCGSCRSGDIDLTPAAFKKIANLKDGRVKVTWKQVSC